MICAEVTAVIFVVQIGCNPIGAMSSGVDLIHFVGPATDSNVKISTLVGLKTMQRNVNGSNHGMHRDICNYYCTRLWPSRATILDHSTIIPHVVLRRMNTLDINCAIFNGV